MPYLPASYRERKEILHLFILGNWIRNFGLLGYYISGVCVVINSTLSEEFWAVGVAVMDELPLSCIDG